MNAKLDEVFDLFIKYKFANISAEEAKKVYTYLKNCNFRKTWFWQN